jgi:hypothetical protein
MRRTAHSRAASSAPLEQQCVTVSKRKALSLRKDKIKLMCGLAACGLLIASCGTESRSAKMTQASPDFAIFAPPPTADDELSSEAVLTLRNSVEPEFSSADMRAARRVIAGDPTWLVPSSNGELCLVRVVYPVTRSQSGSSLPPTVARNCEFEARALEGRLVWLQSLATSTRGSPWTTIVGVAPDGVSTVTIVSGHGGNMRVPVVRNAYEATIAEPKAVRLVRVSAGHRIAYSVLFPGVSGRLATQPEDHGPQPG